MNNSTNTSAAPRPSRKQVRTRIAELLGVNPQKTLPPKELAALIDKAAESAEHRLKLAKTLIRNFSIIPVKSDGSKEPPYKWKPYKSKKAREDELIAWWPDRSTYGIAILGGAVSGNLLILDFEDIDIFCKWLSNAIWVGHGDILKRCAMVRTPRDYPSPAGGVHVYLRLKFEPPGSEKLAMRPVPGENPDTLIETKAFGGYVLSPGSPAKCHENNRTYELICGNLLDLPAIDKDDFDDLLSLATLFDEVEKKQKHQQNNNGAKPCSKIYLSWADVLKPHSFVLTSTDESGEQYWQKPNSSNSGHHVTTNWEGRNLLRCFSSACLPFEMNRSYDMLHAYALLNNDGDTKAAEEALSQQGLILRSSFDDIGNAERLKRTFGKELRWINALRKWHVWDAGRWVIDELAMVTGFAQKVVKNIPGEAS